MRSTPVVRSHRSAMRRGSYRTHLGNDKGEQTSPQCLFFETACSMFDNTIEIEVPFELPEALDVLRTPSASTQADGGHNYLAPRVPGERFRLSVYSELSVRFRSRLTSSCSDWELVEYTGSRGGSVQGTGVPLFICMCM